MFSLFLACSKPLVSVVDEVQDPMTGFGLAEIQAVLDTLEVAKSFRVGHVDWEQLTEWVADDIKIAQRAARSIDF